MDFAGVNVLDLFIGIFIVVSVLRGARTGFLAGVFSVVGVLLKNTVGSRIAPSLMPDGSHQIYDAGITLGSILAFSVLGEVIARSMGASIRNRLAGPASASLDRLGGAALGLALSLVLVWVIGVFALQSPTLAGMQPVAQDSKILQALEDRMPSGLLPQVVADLQPLPKIHGPKPEVAAPEGNIVDDPDVQAASDRTLRVTGIACGYGVEGSAWVAGRDLAVTNAHVVAGEATTQVQIGGVGGDLPAEVVVFDERNDIAILRVDGLGLDPLPVAAARPGEPAAVIGFPENGGLDIEPARTDSTQRVLSTDAYDNGPVERVVTSFRVYVRPGNSGGPAVDAEGRVVSTIFAGRTDSQNFGYGVPSRIVQRHLRAAATRTDPVSTGGCAN